MSCDWIDVRSSFSPGGGAGEEGTGGHFDFIVGDVLTMEKMTSPRWKTGLKSILCLDIPWSGKYWFVLFLIVGSGKMQLSVSLWLLTDLMMPSLFSSAAPCASQKDLYRVWTGRWYSISSESSTLLRHTMIREILITYSLFIDTLIIGLSVVPIHVSVDPKIQYLLRQGHEAMPSLVWFFINTMCRKFDSHQNYLILFGNPRDCPHYVIFLGSKVLTLFFSYSGENWVSHESDNTWRKRLIHREGPASFIFAPSVERVWSLLSLLHP